MLSWFAKEWKCHAPSRELEHHPQLAVEQGAGSHGSADNTRRRGCVPPLPRARLLGVSCAARRSEPVCCSMFVPRFSFCVLVSTPKAPIPPRQPQNPFQHPAPEVCACRPCARATQPLMARHAFACTFVLPSFRPTHAFLSTAAARQARRPKNAREACPHHRAIGMGAGIMMHGPASVISPPPSASAISPPAS